MACPIRIIKYVLLKFKMLSKNMEPPPQPSPLWTDIYILASLKKQLNNLQRAVVKLEK